MLEGKKRCGGMCWSHILSDHFSGVCSCSPPQVWPDVLASLHQGLFLLRCCWSLGACSASLAQIQTWKSNGVSPWSTLDQRAMGAGSPLPWPRWRSISTVPQNPQPDWAPVATVVAGSVTHSWAGFPSFPLSAFPWTFFHFCSLGYLSEINCLCQSPALGLSADPS